MGFLLLGLLLLVLKTQSVSMVADWSWWLVLSPFVLAVVWWHWADTSGYTRRKVIARENERKERRLERQREALGQGGRKRP